MTRYGQAVGTEPSERSLPTGQKRRMLGAKGLTGDVLTVV